MALVWGLYGGAGIALILCVTIPRIKWMYWPLKALMGLLYLVMVEERNLAWDEGLIFLMYYLGDLVLGIPTMELRTKLKWGVGLFGLGHALVIAALVMEVDAVMIGLLIGILFFSFLATVRYWIRTFNLEGLMGPVNAYVLVVMTMGVLGWMVGPLQGMLALGITLFILSDGFLALWHFKTRPWVGYKVINIVLYYTAVAVMIQGF